jgi:opacity protein-like surface antigen
MKRLLVGLCLAVVVLSSGRAAAQQGVDPFLKAAPPGPPESGVSVGLSVGYGIPMGSVSASQTMSDLFTGALPIQIDLGYRFTPNLYLGAFYQFSIGFVSSAQEARCTANNWTSCSVGDMQFGLAFVYTFLPYSSFAPYAGLGIGWEIATINYSGPGGSLSESVSGFQFARLIVGGDFRVGSGFRVGPFVNFSLGQFSGDTIVNSSIHSWLQFGIKGTVDL